MTTESAPVSSYNKDFSISKEIAQETGQACWAQLQLRITEKGDYSFSGQHEAYGVILEELAELQDAVRKNSRENVRQEVMDIFVPAFFEWASMEDRIKENLRTRGLPTRFKVDLKGTGKKLLDPEILWLTHAKTRTSIHDILGALTLHVRRLEGAKDRQYYDMIRNVVFECMVDIASLDTPKRLDW